MHFVLQTPPLQHLAGVTIVAQLWSQDDVFTRITQVFNVELCYEARAENTKKWREIEVKVRNKVWALPLPKPCKQQLFNFIKPIGMEIFAWCLYHHFDDYVFGFLDCSSPQLRWTMHGTIDYAKTAQLMVRDERVDVDARYKIACINCLEDEARQLIGHIPLEERIRKFVGGWRFGKKDHRTLIAFYTRRILLGSTQIQFDIDLFKAVLRVGSRATCEYLFAQLSSEEKERVLAENPMRFFRRDTDIKSSTCNWMYYLSLINEKQQEIMFRESTRGLLILLLRWPLRVLFVEAAERGWSHMNRWDCGEVLSAIAVKINNGYRDDDYFQLFWQCWGLTSADGQQYFLNTYDLEGLFAAREEKFLLLILNRAPTHQLEKLTGYGYYLSSPVLMDERLIIISDAALLECKKKAALNSLKEPENVEKRLRSQYVGRIVDLELGRRMKRRL